MQIEITEERLSLTLSDELYSEVVLYKCFYWYGKDYIVAITKEGAPFYVIIEPKEGLLDAERSKRLVEKIKQDLIDFKLRAIVTEETKTVRDLITAKAFAYYEMETAPSTIVSDPVGFDPTKTKLYE